MEPITANMPAVDLSDVQLRTAQFATVGRSERVESPSERTHLRLAAPPELEAGPAQDSHPHEEVVSQPPDESMALRVLVALTAPHDSIERDHERRRARVLASFLLVGVVVMPIVTAVWSVTAVPSAPLLIAEWSTVAAVVGLWALARTRFYRHVAIAITTITIAWIAATGLVGRGPSEFLATATLASAALFVGALVLSTRETLVLLGAALATTAVTVVLAPQIPVDAGIPPLLLLSFGTATLLVSGRLGRADQETMASQSEALVRSQERYEMAARGATDGLWDWDLRTGAVFLSPRWCQLLGLTTADVPPTLHGWFDRVHGDDLPGLRRSLATFMASTDPIFEGTHRVRHASGGWRWFRVRGHAMRDEEGRVLRIAGSQSDITERRAFEDQLTHDAFHDPLTGLPNRALFLNRVTHCLARQRRRQDRRFAVLFLDLDRFKVINDSLGHRVGDLLLKSVARRLKSCLRPGDTVARLGGDEFTILLDEMGEVSDATDVACRIRSAMELPFQFDGHEIVTSVSIGIAPSTTQYTRPENLIRDADTAMYQVKAQGRAGHQLFDRQMHDDAVRRLRLESDLRRALDRREFRVHYQPTIDLASGKIIGFEALVRWMRDGQTIAPSEFIPIAEETGLIEQIDGFVMVEACRQVRQWQQRWSAGRELSLNVNVSGRQFRGHDLCARIESILHATGFPPGSLRVEITESIVMEDAARSRELLSSLRALGVRIAIDDFGTGYSSLNYLHEFDVDDLKVDRSFVMNMGEVRDTARIVETVIGLGHGLGMAVTAEGVETPDQLARIRALGCETAQGYWFSRPVDATAAWALLEDDPTW